MGLLADYDVEQTSTVAGDELTKVERVSQRNRSVQTSDHGINDANTFENTITIEQTMISYRNRGSVFRQQLAVNPAAGRVAWMIKRNRASGYLDRWRSVTGKQPIVLVNGPP